MTVNEILNDLFSSHLGRAVVSGDDVGRHHEGGAGRARQTEVQDLEGTVTLHHYVGRF